MPNRSAALETTRIVLALLQLIPRASLTTASVLRGRLAEVGFDRNLRTVQRLLDLLCADFDIERDDRERPYGYRWKPHANGFIVPAMSEEQSLLFALAERQILGLIPRTLERSLTRSFAQARASVGRAGRYPKAGAWLSKVRVIRETQALRPAVVDASVFDAVSQALYHDLWLDVMYQNAAGSRVSARVMPLGIAQQGPRMYLVCRFDGFEDNRILALHRLASAQSTTEPFESPSDFDLERFADEGRFGIGEGRQVRVRFRIDAAAGAHLRETPLSDDQTLTLDGNSIDVLATVFDSRQLDWWLRAFGDQVSGVVKEPIGRSR